MPLQTTRYAHIDSLRAIAALLVLWMHASEVFVRTAPPSLQDPLYHVARALDFGRLGVVIFFAISGFVIPASLRGDVLTAWRTFLIRRLFRLYPVYWLSIPLGLATSWWIWGRDMPLSAILWNFTMLQEAAGHPSAEGLYWTLQTELVFYALCMLLFACRLLHSATGLSAVLLLLGVLPVTTLGAGFVGLRLPVALDPRSVLLAVHLSIMFWAAMFRLWYDGQPLPVFARLLLAAFPAAWMLAALLLNAHGALTTGHEDAARLFLPYGLGLAVFTVLAKTSRLRPAWLVWLGTISYSLYLFHPVVMYTLHWLAVRQGVDVLRDWPIGASMLTVALGTVALSAVTYRYIERPAMQLGSRLAAWPFRRSGTTTPQAADPPRG